MSSLINTHTYRGGGRNTRTVAFKIAQRAGLRDSEPLKKHTHRDTYILQGKLSRVIREVFAISIIDPPLGG